MGLILNSSKWNSSGQKEWERTRQSRIGVQSGWPFHSGHSCWLNLLQLPFASVCLSSRFQSDFNLISLISHAQRKGEEVCR